MSNIAIEREIVTKLLCIFVDKKLSWKQHKKDISKKLSKSIGTLYKSSGTVKESFLKQLHFFFRCHLNYANIIWASTYKSKFEGLYCHQIHAIQTINLKNKFTHVQPLRHDMKALSIFQINSFHIICFMFKCKGKIAPPIFHKCSSLNLKISTIFKQEDN